MTANPSGSKQNILSRLTVDASFCPDGTIENSPAFQRRVWRDRRLSPEGTAELGVLSRPFGTWPAQPRSRRWNAGLLSTIPPGWRRWNLSGIGHAVRAPKKWVALKHGL